MAEASWREVLPLEQLMADECITDNPVVVTACFALSRSVDLAWLQAILLPRFLRHPRFSASVLPDSNGKLRFHPVHNFTPTSTLLTDHHVVIEPPLAPSAPRKERERLFSARVSEIMSAPLDLTRPLWKLFLFPAWSLVEPDTGSDEGSMLVFRIHHSIADGIGLVKYFSSHLIDQGSEQHLPQLLVVPKRQRELLRDQMTPPGSCAVSAESEPVPGYMQSLKKHKFSVPAPGLLRRVWEAVEDVYLSTVRVLFPEPDSVFTRSAIQREKVCALLPPSEFSVQAVKDASWILGITMNDLLFTAVAGASRAYLKEHGDNPDELARLRCAIPFNRHMLDDFQMRNISNQFAIIPLALHINESDRMVRLKRCVESLQRLKRSNQSALTLGLLKAVTYLPRLPRRVLWRHLTRAASILFTNVPGPKRTVQLGGVDITSAHFFAPSDGHAGIVVALFSYDGKIAIGVSGDKGRMSNPQRFVDLLAQEIEGLIQLSEDV